MSPVDGALDGEAVGCAGAVGEATGEEGAGLDAGAALGDDEVEMLEAIDEEELVEVDVVDVEADEVDATKPMVVMALGVPG